MTTASEFGRRFRQDTIVWVGAALGAALREARKRLSLTQSELAIAAGVGLRFVVELERGKPSVRLEQVLRVIDALGGVVMVDGLGHASPTGAVPRDG